MTACLARSSSPPSPTTQSHSNGDFPAFGEDRRIDGLARGRWVSVSGDIGSRGKFRHHRLWPQNSVSRQQRQRQAETGSNAALLLGKAENLVLLAPLGGQVGEASNPHAMRQPPVDRRTRGGAPTNPRRGPADRREHRQAAGASHKCRNWRLSCKQWGIGRGNQSSATRLSLPTGAQHATLA
jgi:hypothetical protein